MRLNGLPLMVLGSWLVDAQPFLTQVDDHTWTFGNDLWNVTQGAVYANKAYYGGQELVGSAVGHYMGYDGENDFEWTSASIVAQADDFIDIGFSTTVGDLHWVVFDGLAGSYQYFVNRGVPDLSILRTLWRLDPNLFLNGRTYLRDQPLPDFSLYANATKVQDETWQLANGTFITKYDFSDFVRDRDFYGIYGPEVGSWYIHPGTDYYNSNQLSQTLTVHRESATGDSVQLNVVQDTSHFRVGETTPQPAGKIWGPWLWYLNDGSISNAQEQRELELQKWPYSWLNDTAYQSRGELTGSLVLSDGRPASGAAVYLGDTNTTVRPLVQGSNYYYTTYADDNGSFSFSDVRSGDYGLYAWSNGGVIADVYTNFTTSSVSISQGEITELPSLTWEIPSDRQSIFQIGEFDKKALGFTNGGPPYQHGLADESPANLTYTIGSSNVSDWYYAQSLIGTWTIEFSLSHDDVATHINGTALLSISLAGYSQSTALDVDVNGEFLGTLSKDTLASDPAMYRSGKTSGEWRFFQYEIATETLTEELNTVGLTVTQYTQWRGFMWDSIILEWS
ncbi:polysaccharide lyase family 4, domain III-domain-containing protein [Xylariales sp. AK1849]|nr:polysaccharide lyase family 4, domain III-domain-containing protein [Xylariales sp. AK1849]